jgi:hypothetical protein
MMLPIAPADPANPTAQNTEDDAPAASSKLDENQLAALSRLVQRRDQMNPEQRATIELIAKQNNVPLPPAAGFTDQGNPLKENVSELGQAAKVSALPMAGQAIGGILGSAIAPGMGSILGQSAGGVAGLYANKALGISNPDSLDAALTGAVPALGKGLTVGMRRGLPGAAAAEQQIGVEMMGKAFPEQTGLKAATTAAYEKVEALGSPAMPVPSYQQTINTLFDTEQTAKKYGAASPQIRRAVQEAGKTMEAQQGTMPFRDVEVMLKRYRQQTSKLEGQGGEVWGAYKDMRRALFEDMEKAVSSGHAAKDNVIAMREAIAASKKQIAHDELSELVAKYGTKWEVVNGQSFQIIQPKVLMNKLEQMDWKASAGAPAYQKNMGMLKDLAKIPAVDTLTGTGVGTSGRAVAMIGAGLAAQQFGGTMLHGAGGAMAAYAAIRTHDAVATLMMSDKGRNALVKLFKANQGRMSEQTSQIIQFFATQLEDTGEEPQQKPQQVSRAGVPGIPTPEQEALEGPTVEPSDIGNAAKMGLTGLKGLGLAGGAMLGMFKVKSPHHGTYYAADRDEAEKIVRDMRANSPSTDGSDRRIRPRIIDLDDPAYIAKEKERRMKKFNIKSDEEYERLFGDKK